MRNKYENTAMMTINVCLLAKSYLFVAIYVLESVMQDLLSVALSLAPSLCLCVCVFWTFNRTILRWRYMPTHFFHKQKVKRHFWLYFEKGNAKKHCLFFPNMDKSHNLNGKWYWKSARLEFISVEINLNLDWVNHNLRLDSIFYSSSLALFRSALVLFILFKFWIWKRAKKIELKWKEKGTRTIAMHKSHCRSCSLYIV